MKTLAYHMGWWIFAALCVAIGFYPLSYFFMDQSSGLLATKSLELLEGPFWQMAFYGHISFGGIALLVGWTQFRKSWRTKYLRLHRTVGKVYVLAVLVSGLCAVYIAFFATGGLVSSLGFLGLGLTWLSTTFLAYRAIQKGQLQVHQRYMIYSYAACFAAVTLRIWLPILTPVFGAFDPAYRLVAWLCWLPNMAVAYAIIRSQERKEVRT